MKSCVIHIDDEVNCRLGGLHPEHLSFLYEKFGIFVEGYRYTPQYQLRRWDGKIRYVEKSGKTYTKLLDEIVPFLCTWGYDVELEDKRFPSPVITTKIDENFFGIENFKLRPYQVDVVNALLADGSGFAVMGTGAGKTSLAAALSMVLYQHGLQTLIIVPSSDLVDQTVNEFKDRLINFDVTIGQYSGSSKEIDHPIVVGTWQSLQNAPHFIQNFSALLVDECFHGEMKVLTPNGYVEIKKLKIGDKVLNSDLNGTLLVDEVIKIHESLSISEDMLELDFDNGTIIKVTANHKFFTLNRGWVRADELNFDDEIDDIYKYPCYKTMGLCDGKDS